MMDNPDILETFLTFWNDCATKKMKEKEKYDMSRLMELSEEYISKVYPVVYNPSFEMDEHNTHLASECFPSNPDLKKIRTTMILNSLNDRKLDFDDKKSDPITVDDSYKPFNIRELDSAKVLAEAAQS